MKGILKKTNFFFLFVLFSGCYPDDIIIPYSFPTTQTSSATEFVCSREYYNAHDFTSGRRLWNTQEKTSNDGRTKIVINTYFANTHTINQIQEGKNANHLSVSVDPDEVLVGGGSSVFLYNDGVFNWSRMMDVTGDRYYACWWDMSRWDNVQAFISSSYPVDDNSFSTWAADSKGSNSAVEEYKHHLRVTAVGMKVFYDGQLIPSASLKANMDISKKFTSLDLSNGQGVGLWAVTSKWVPLAVGVKTCWTEDGDGWFISRIATEEDNSKQEGCIAGAAMIRERNTINTSIYSKATANLYCLSLRNINPNDNSKPLFKHTFTKMFTGMGQNQNNGNGLIQRFRASPTAFSELVISVFGGTLQPNPQFNAICNLSPLGMGDCWPAAAELVTKYRFPGEANPIDRQRDGIPNLTLLEISPN